MSLLRLTAKIDANATQFHSAMGAVDARAAKSGNYIARQFKSAFGYFIGFAAISRAVRGVDDMVKNFDELKPRLQELGIVVDEGLVQNARKARAEFEAMTLQLKTEALPAMAAFYSKVARAAIWLYGASRILTTPSFSEMKKIWGETGESIDRLSLAQPGRESKTIKDVGAAKAISEAIPKLTQDALAKIGGFTGRAGEEMKSLQFRQLRQLEKIQTNTEPLKRGIG
jgi:hypothetical protein